MKNKNRSKVYSLLIVKRVMFIQRSDVLAKKIYVIYNEVICLLKATYIQYNRVKLFTEKTNIQTRVKDVVLILLIVSKQGESFCRQLIT